MNRLRSFVRCGKPSVSTKPGQDRVHLDPARAQQRRDASARTRAARASTRRTRPPARRRRCRRPRRGSRRARPAGGARRPGSERAQAPDAAEVVRPDHALDESPGRRREKLPRAGTPALFTRRPIAGWRSSTRAATSSTCARSAHVADLPLAADLVRRRARAGPRVGRGGRSASPFRRARVPSPRRFPTRLR